MTDGRKKERCSIWLKNAFSAILTRKQMSDQLAIPSASKALPQGLLARIAMMFLLFSGVLSLLLVCSGIFLLPRFTSFFVEGKRLSPKEMVQHERTLRAKVLAMEQERTRLALPFIDATYEALKMKKRAQPSILTLRMDLLRARTHTGAAEAIVIDDIALDALSGRVTVTGDVRGIGPRSMTVLAAFTEEVEKLPSVTALQPPAFSRAEDEAGNIHSPFTFSFTAS